MKEKKWTFFRVAVYLCLAGAIMVLSLLSYIKFYQYPNLRASDVPYLILSGTLVSQITFNIFNIRLIHHYLANKQRLQNIFNSWHTVLLVFNSFIAIALIFLFLYTFFDTFKTGPYRNHPKAEDITVLAIVGSYTLFTIYTITGSFILKRYIRHLTTLQEEDWINQLGSPPII